MTETTTVTRIVWHLNVPDLFDRWEEDELDDVDQDASGDRYVELVNAQLLAQYPGAEIVCEIDRNATGPCPEPIVELSDDTESDLEATYVQDVIGRVYADQKWIVKLSPIKTTIRLSPSGHRKLLWLAERYRNQTTVFEMAIDRMWREEGGR